MGTLSSTSATRQLSSLAQQINEQHRLANDAVSAGLHHALNAGNLLRQAKERVPHGQWLDWLKNNVTVTPRQAQKWMRAAEKWPEIEAANANSGSHLSINEGLRLIADQKEPEPEIDEWDYTPPVPPPGHALAGTIGDDEEIVVLVQPSDRQNFYHLTVLIGEQAEISQKPVRSPYAEKFLSILLPEAVECDDISWREPIPHDPIPGDHELHRPWWKYREPEIDDPTGRLAELEARIAHAWRNPADGLAAIEEVERDRWYRYGFSTLEDYLSDRFGFHRRFVGEDGTVHPGDLDGLRHLAEGAA